MAYIMGRSTQSALNFISNTLLNNMDKGLYTCASLIDLSKCFDCVPHDFLLHKLTKYGILDNEYRWFNSYLSNRKQLVAFNNILSLQETVNIGVPQGTVLGKILYLIYT